MVYQNNPETTQKTEKEQRKATQVIGCRVSKDNWHQLERKCLATGRPMSAILQQAVVDYLKN